MLYNIAWVLSILILPLLLWHFFSQMSFTQAEGKFRRGVKIWSKPLTPGERDFLEEIPSTIKSGDVFILKRDREVIISQARWWSRSDLWYYIGYVHLGVPSGQLEFRMPWSDLSFLLTIFLLMLLGFVPKLFMGVDLNFALIIPFGLFFGLGTWILIQHYQEKALILEILSQVMSKKNELINSGEWVKE